MVINIRSLKYNGFLAYLRMRYCLLILFISCLPWLSLAQQINLKDVKGKEYSLNQLQKQPYTVYIFLSPECPLCQSYSLTLKLLHEKYATKGFTFIGVVPGTDFTNEQITTYKIKYKIPFLILKDETSQLVKKMKATITPEVFLVNAKQQILYQGRIDNWAYELGKKRKVITEHDLLNAIDAMLLQKPIIVSKTKAIGCYIE